jgi:hypothetical protein
MTEVASIEQASAKSRLLHLAASGRGWPVGLGATCLAGVLLAMLGSFEISGESWNYWLFARVFAETGEFIIPDRSPLYIIYLNGFRWLGYPLSVTLEQLVAGLVLAAAIVALSRSFLGNGLAALAFLVWVPFFGSIEPAIINLGLALSLFGLLVRRSGAGPAGIAASYFLFGLAYMLRPSFGIFIAAFAVWDVWSTLRQRPVEGVLKSVRAGLAKGWVFWILVLLMLGLFAWFSANQSDHRWNNANPVASTWSPLDNPKSLAATHYIQAWNWKYIEQEYGTFKDKDWYFTNDELFDGAGSIAAAFRANPRFILEQAVRNSSSAMSRILEHTELRTVRSSLRILHLDVVWRGIALIAISAIILGAYKASNDGSTRVFVVTSVMFVALTTLALPTGRRLIAPFIPLLILSAAWYGMQVREVVAARYRTHWTWFLALGTTGASLISLYLIVRVVLGTLGASIYTSAVVGYVITLTMVGIGFYGRRNEADESGQRLDRYIGPAIGAVAIIFLSLGSISWWSLGNRIADNLITGETRVMEYTEVERYLSMKASFDEMKPLISECRGIMTLEHTFLGAFTNVPLDSIYDIMEVPPFGRLGESDYDGLQPSRIDCVLVSDRLTTTIGHGTNVQIRYDNYVEPYIEQLEEMGASVYDIERYGRLVILKDSG